MDKFIGLKNKNILVTGGAGFIGSNLVAELMKKGNKVVVYDNLSLGRKEFLKDYFKDKNFKLVVGDLLDEKLLAKSIKGCDIVFHLAANSDISFNQKRTDTDLKNGTLATYNVLEAMRKNNIRQIAFSSSSAVYGDAEVMPTPESYGPLFPISLYGAGKLACEGLVSAFCHIFGMQAWIFRFANIIGDNGTHGVAVNFIRELKKNPKNLEILADGEQAKPYIYVKECVSGVLYGVENSDAQLNCFNLACQGATSVKTIADIITEEMGLENVSYAYTGGKRGWPGDVPQVRLDAKKINDLGWKTELNSDQAVRVGVKALLKNNF